MHEGWQREGKQIQLLVALGVSEKFPRVRFCLNAPQIHLPASTPTQAYSAVMTVFIHNPLKAIKALAGPGGGAGGSVSVGGLIDRKAGWGVQYTKNAHRWLQYKSKWSQ